MTDLNAAILGLLGLVAQFTLLLTVVQTMNTTRDRVLGYGPDAPQQIEHRRLLFESDWMTMWVGSVLAATAFGIFLIVAGLKVASLQGFPKWTAIAVGVIFLLSGIGHGYGGWRDYKMMRASLGGGGEPAAAGSQVRGNAAPAVSTQTPGSPPLQTSPNRQ